MTPKLEKRLKRLKDEREAYKKSGLWKKAVDCCFSAADLLFNHDESEEALIWYRDAWEILKTRSVTSCINESEYCLMKLAECYSHAALVDEAIEYAQKYLKFIEENYENIPEYNLNLQNAHILCGRMFYVKACSIQEADHNTVEESSFNAQDLLNTSLQNFNTALTLSDVLPSEKSDLQVLIIRSRIYINMGLVNEQLGELQKAQSEYTISLGLARSASHPPDICKSLWFLGKNLLIQEKYSDACNNLMELLEHMATVNEDLINVTRSEVFLYIGISHLFNDHYDEAIKSFIKSHDEVLKLTPEDEMILNLSQNVALQCRKLSKSLNQHMNLVSGEGIIHHESIIVNLKFQLKDKIKNAHRDANSECDRDLMDQIDSSYFDDQLPSSLENSSEDDLEERMVSSYVRNKSKKRYPSRRKTDSSRKRNTKGETLLHIACIKGNLNEVEDLIQRHSFDINARDNCGWTPLHEACNHGYADIVKVLLENKANVNDTGGHQCGGITPLMDAAGNGHFEVCSLLINFGADIRLRDRCGRQAIDMLEDLDLEDCEIEKWNQLLATNRKKLMPKSLRTSKGLSRSSSSSILTTKHDTDRNSIQFISENFRKKPDPLISEVQPSDDDWLIQDIASKKMKCQTPRPENASSSRKRRRSSIKDNFQNSFIERQEKTGYTQNEYDIDVNEMMTVETDYVETKRIEYDNSYRTYSVNTGENIRYDRKVRVYVNSDCFLIPYTVDDNKMDHSKISPTFEWLETEVSNRYRLIYNETPILRFSVYEDENIVLYQKDQLHQILKDDEKIKSKILGWKSSSLTEKYTEECKNTNIPVSDHLLQWLSEKNSSDNTDLLLITLSHSQERYVDVNCDPSTHQKSEISSEYLMLDFTSIIPIINVIGTSSKFQNISRFQFSHRVILENELPLISRFLSNLQTLRHLDLACSGLNAKTFFSLVNISPQTINHPWSHSLIYLNLSHNTLFPSKSPKIASEKLSIMLKTFQALQIIVLSSCSLPYDMYSEEGDYISILHEHSSLKSFDISRNRLSAKSMLNLIINGLPWNNFVCINFGQTASSVVDSTLHCDAFWLSEFAHMLRVSQLTIEQLILKDCNLSVQLPGFCSHLLRDPMTFIPLFSSLVKLDLSLNQLDDEILENNLLPCLHHFNALRYLDLSGNVSISNSTALKLLKFWIFDRNNSKDTDRIEKCQELILSSCNLTEWFHCDSHLEFMKLMFHSSPFSIQNTTIDQPSSEASLSEYQLSSKMSPLIIPAEIPKLSVEKLNIVAYDGDACDFRDVPEDEDDQMHSYSPTCLGNTQSRMNEETLQRDEFQFCVESGTDRLNDHLEWIHGCVSVDVSFNKININDICDWSKSIQNSFFSSKDVKVIVDVDENEGYCHISFSRSSFSPSTSSDSDEIFSCRILF